MTVPQDRKGHPCPPEPPPRVPPVLTLGPEESVTVIVASRTLYGVYLHWVERRSRLCPSGTGPCALCAAKKIPAWYAYGLCLLLPSGDARLLQVSAHQYRHCGELMAADGELAGTRWQLYRTGRRKNSPLGIRPLTGGSLVELPPLPPLKACLERLLGTKLPT